MKCTQQLTYEYVVRLLCEIHHTFSDLCTAIYNYVLNNEYFFYVLIFYLV